MCKTLGVDPQHFQKNTKIECKGKKSIKKIIKNKDKKEKLKGIRLKPKV